MNAAEQILFFGPNGASGAVAQLFLASTRLRIPANFDTIPGGSNKAVLSKISAGSPAYDIRNPRVFLPAFYCDGLGGSPTELQAPNTFTYFYSLEYNGVRYRATFGGAGSVTRGGAGSTYGYSTAYDWGIWSDPIPVTIPANSIFYHLTIAEVANAADGFPSSQYTSALIGDAQVVAANSSTLVPLLTSGTITTAGSGPSHLPAPSLMVAEGWDGRAVVIGVGDSRWWGTGEFRTGQPDPRAVRHAAERGLDSTTGGRIANNTLAIPGSSPDTTLVAPGMDHRAAPLQYIKALTGRFPFTHIVDQHGNNGNLDYDTELAAHVAAVKVYFPGTPYIKVTLPPRIGQVTTDAFRTLANVTPGAADTYPSGSRAVFNGKVIANTSSLFDGTYDVGVYEFAGNDTDFNRSRFPTAPRSGALTRDWDGTATVGMYLDFAAQVGDLINWDSAARGNTVMVTTVTAQGAGEWLAALENGVGLGTPKLTGTSLVVIPTADGTHEGPWVAMLGKAGYEQMKLSGLLGHSWLTNHAPTNITLSSNTISTTAAHGDVVGTLSTTDQDLWDTFTYTLLDSAGGMFQISGAQVQVGTTALTAGTHDISVRTTDLASNTYDKTFTITASTPAAAVTAPAAAVVKHRNAGLI